VNAPGAAGAPASPARLIVACSIVAASYVLAGKVGLTLAFINPSTSAVWPPSGIALAAFLIFGPRVWPGIFLGAFLVNESTAGSLATSLGIATGNTLEGLTGAYLVSRFAAGREAFQRVRHLILVVLLAGLFSTTISATIGVTSLALGGFAEWSDFRSIWLTWWLGDATGITVVAPVIILWANNPRLDWPPFQRLELLVLFLVLCFLGWVTFVLARVPLAFVCIPCCVWAGFRFGQREAATAALVLSAIATWAAGIGLGQFAGYPTNSALLVVQIFIAVASLIGLTVAAAVSGRKLAEDEVRKLNDDLEHRVGARTAALQSAIDALVASESRLAEAQEVAHIGSWEWTIPEDRLWWSEELHRMVGVDRASFKQSYEAFAEVLHPDDRERVDSSVRRAVEDRQPFDLEFRLVRPGGDVRTIQSRGRLVCDDQGRVIRVIGTAQDLTDRARLEGQLRQAQKMEAVGLLAGGVAHDFNNTLTAILGYSEDLLSQIGDDKPISDDLRQIRKAAEAAAGLTKQLLAFSSRQMIRVSAVDLNEAITAVERMLRRTISENITFVTKLPRDLKPIEADATHLQQVLLNLALNARDAMPRGGTLTIETANVELTPGYAASHAGIEPGRYVRLAVSDTGHGMDAATKARVFEPFFTTKEQGRGTGLGLATVYGIVRQLRGAIWIYSEPDQGTTFKVYFREAHTVVERAAAAPARPLGLVGEERESVLLVEDDDRVRAFAKLVLKRYGYRVHEAESPVVALKMAGDLEGPIHLLLTDVIMPGMNGRELAGQLSRIRPQTRTLYMSGYTGEAMLQQGLSVESLDLLEKPFTSTALLRRVRDVLDGTSVGA
jgi:PAS domain S-box-containing protein